MNRYALPLSLLALLPMLNLCPSQAQVIAVPQAMNFQGRLATPSGNPVPDGTYSIRFSLWNALSAGTERWNQILASVQVKNGAFAVSLSGFPANTFDGNLWLETQIGTDAPLTPRQPLVSVPYALKSNLALTVPDASVTGAKIANGTITADKFASGAFNSLAWLLGGNSGTNPASQYLGTTDNQPLVFRTNNAERMRLLPGGNFGLGLAAPTALLHLNGSMKINANNTLEFGAGVANKEVSAGKIGYQTFTSDALDIVGAGTTAANRKIRFFAEGGAAFAGAIAAPSATIPILNGNVAVGGEIIANVVTVLGGSDVAEPYNVAPAGNIAAIPGYVVAIDPDKVGQMRVVSKAYDATVAGIVSGANGVNPGITLRQKGTVADGEMPVASIGRVWCWCDADANGAIEAGDMLTTSDTPGHAMKVTDHTRANGSVIGKAMSSLKSGKGLVLVLVSLK